VQRPTRKFRADERGATSIEYGLIVAIMGLGLVVGLSSFPGALNSIFAEVAGNIK
jgi:pilus assembly protein Flp/PilA